MINLLGGMEAGTVNVAGTLDASAPSGGHGGAIETSAANVKVAEGAQITTAAASGNTGSWLIDPADFTIGSTATGTVTSGTPTGDISGTTLSTALGSVAVTILSTQGSTSSGSGNINVNDAVSWSANKLTLSAQNNININANMTATNTASLALNYGLGAGAAGNTSQIITAAGKSVSLPAGTTNFTTTQGSGSGVTQKSYTVITSLGDAGSSTKNDLQGMKGDLGLNYALGTDIDACLTGGNCISGATTPWNTGDGFTPIGTVGNGYTGTFNGLGHTISNLTINRSDTSYVGLFGKTSSTNAVINNLGMIGGSIKGSAYVGGLVGDNYANISNSYSTGSVTGTANKVGGLIGQNRNALSNSFASGNVTGSSYAGGLVGYNGSNGGISNSYATGSVTGTGNYVGGLAGQNNSVVLGIHNSYATGRVSGTDDIGGLIGANIGNVSSSYATGNVSGSNNLGGLAGSNTGGEGGGYSVLFGSGVGSLGSNTLISNTYATGTVTGTGTGSNVGGLVGVNSGGKGGQAGYWGNTGGHGGSANISKSYSIGAVSGTANVGGLVGLNQSGSNGVGLNNGTGGTGGSIGAITNSFYDTTVNGTLTGIAGSIDVVGNVLGLSTAAMKLVANFTSSTTANGNTNPSWDFSTPSSEVWNISSGTNGGYPFLCSIVGGCVVQTAAAPTPAPAPPPSISAGSTTTISGLAGYTPILSGGTLVLSNGDSSNTALTVASAGGTIQNPSTGSATLSGAFTGSGGLTFTGTGTTVLTGANAYTGGTTVASGTLQGNTSSLQGNVTNNGTVVFDQPTQGTFTGAITGSGKLVTQNTGTLVLTGNNTYTGGTTVNAGSNLSISSGSALGTGSLDLRSSGTNTATLSVTADTIITNTIILSGD